jgi:hypothetical protein
VCALGLFTCSVGGAACQNRVQHWQLRDLVAFDTVANKLYTVCGPNVIQFCPKTKKVRLWRLALLQVRMMNATAERGIYITPLCIVEHAQLVLRHHILPAFPSIGHEFTDQSMSTACSTVLEGMYGKHIHTDIHVWMDMRFR